jgi:D-xylose 1-dehydrogenase (NADP+, D-xylono-1,5-lactone-forming)
MYRHHPQTKKIGEIIQSGKLGEITLFRGVFNFYLPEKQRQPGNLNVRLIPEFGGGSLWDVGVYPISLAQFVIGRAPSWVFGSRKMGETRVDESFSGLLGYSGFDQSGPTAQISCSFETPFHTRAEIIGTEGKLEITRPFTNLNRGRKLIYTNRKGRSRKIKTSQKSLYLGEVEDMHEVILDGAEPLISLEESRNHVATVLALYQSANSEQVARL